MRLTEPEQGQGAWCRASDGLGGKERPGAWFSVFQTVSLGKAVQRGASEEGGRGTGAEEVHLPCCRGAQTPSPRADLREASTVTSREDGWVAEGA